MGTSYRNVECKQWCHLPCHASSSANQPTVNQPAATLPAVTRANQHVATNISRISSSDRKLSPPIDVTRLTILSIQLTSGIVSSVEIRPLRPTTQPMAPSSSRKRPIAVDDSKDDSSFEDNTTMTSEASTSSSKDSLKHRIKVFRATPQFKEMYNSFLQSVPETA